MPIGIDLKSQYVAVLEDLDRERTDIQRELGGLQKRLRELDNTITTLRRRVDPAYQPSQRPLLEMPIQPVQTYPPEEKYAYIGVRWAVLHLLSESDPLSTADIAEKLKAAGVRTKAANFSNNVSAVLTTTMRTKGSEEVEAIDGKWRLTELGRNKIAHIVTSEDFRRSCPWAEVSRVEAPSAATLSASK
jgi:hypothetical protein